MGAVCYLQEGSLVQAPPLGSRVVVCGRVMYFAHAENEGQFDARAYYASLGYDFQLTNAELLKVSPGSGQAGGRTFSVAGGCEGIL